MINLTTDELRILMRLDFAAFSHRVFRHLHPTQPLLSNWHLDVIMAKLEECRTGKCRRLIINVYPRSLKSLLASVTFPAWVLGHDPSARFMCVSYAQELADKHARDCRSIVAADWYQRLFPRTRLSDQRQAVAEFVTTMNGCRIATSLGGVVTGLGADFIIIDDPLKADDAMSDVRRSKANEWIKHTLFSRLNDRRTGCIILVMQRLHEDDASGNSQQQSGEEWEVLSFPAVAEEPQTFSWETPFGRFQHHRAIGDVLHPERLSREQLQTDRADLGEYGFASQYQQNPVPVGGGMIKKEWLLVYRPDQLPPTFDLVVQSWDTANRRSELNNYSACTTWGVKDNHYYLLDVLRQRLDYPSLKRAVREQWRKFKATVVLVEDQASGTQLIQDLLADGVRAVTPYVPQGDKTMRLRTQTAVIENGFMHIPPEAPWLPDYLRELTTFPVCKHDDQVDSTSQFLDWVRRRGPASPFFDSLRQMQEEERRRTTETTVKLKVPKGTSTVFTITGRRILVQEGIIAVTEEEAESLRANGFVDVEPRPPLDPWWKFPTFG